MSKPQREFLDWQRPALLSAVDYLHRRYAQPGGEWDLSRAIIVVPGRRAGRRLLELLVLTAEKRRQPLVPPTITTEGRLPELLYHPKKPFADELTQDLTWSQALKSLPESQLKAIAPYPPESHDAAAWMKLGRILRQRHTELAADRLDFAHVCEQGEKLPTFPDAARWQAMATTQQQYLATLDGLSLWDIQTARLRAIEFEELKTEQDILLLGTVDLNRTLRAMLGAVSDRVTALVAAPITLSDRFDEFGCIVPERWREAVIEFDDTRVVRVDGPADQADAVGRILAGYNGKYRGDEITIGVPDEQLVAHVERQLQQSGVPVRWVEGQRLPATGPYRLLQAAAELLESESTQAFAALVRHPDLFEQLTSGDAEDRIGWRLLTELDELLGEYLVQRLAPKHWPSVVRREIEEKQAFQNVVRAVQRVEAWLAPMHAKPQPLSRWSAAIMALLEPVYRKESREGVLYALEKIRDRLQQQLTLPKSLDPTVSAGEALRWTLSQLDGEAVPPPPNEEAVELLGWLELPLDDAPALVVTTFNEGYVPQSSSADAFLPNGFRTALGLVDSDRLYARDAYAVSVVAASRESVHWITARRDAENNPLAPSRLLFAASEKEIPARAMRFFSPLAEAPVRAPLIGADVPAPKQSRLCLVSPRREVELPKRLKVTQFRDYLACPYRFYLRHILGLRAASDLAEELAANAFGNVLHRVLERFGAEEGVRDSREPKTIFDFLNDELNLAIGVRYGAKQRLPAIDLQVEQMRARLRGFAEWQARHRASGWRIILSETTDDETAKTNDAEVDVDGQPFLLGGRIDRIDQHEGSGEYLVLDYKTGDRADTPEQVHRRRRAGVPCWVDLQLPLYRHLAEHWGYHGAKQLGYIVLPRKADEAGHRLAVWRPDDLESADETMCAVVRGIRNAVFWPPADPPAYDDDFTPLCQDRRQGGRLLPDAAEAHP